MNRRLFAKCLLAVPVPALLAPQAGALPIMVRHTLSGAPAGGGGGGGTGHGYTPTHYASVAGAGSHNGSVGNEWTAAEAFANAVAGNIVEFAPGEYSANDREEPLGPCFRPSASGTSGNPIIFVAQNPAAYESTPANRCKMKRTAPSAESTHTGGTSSTTLTDSSQSWSTVGGGITGTVFINTTDGSSGIVTSNTATTAEVILRGGSDNQWENGDGYFTVSSPVMGAGGTGAYRSYIIFDGFWFDYADGGMPTPRGVMYLGFGNGNNQIRRCRFDRVDLNNGDGGDNFNCIHIHDCDNAAVSDCHFVSGYDDGGSHNSSCITTYGAIGFTFEYNRFEDVTCGMYIKGSFGGVGNSGIIRYNRFTGFKYGIELTENDLSNDVEVYQNLFYDWDVTGAESAINFENSVGADAQNFVVHHNTIIQAPGSGVGSIGFETGINMTGNELRDNLVVALAANTQVLVNAYQVSDVSPFTAWDYNWYYNNGATPTFAYNSSVESGITDWRTALPGTFEDNSQVGNPNFTDAGNDDYTIASGSALTASSTGGPVGCYITGSEEIGLRASPAY